MATYAPELFTQERHQRVTGGSGSCGDNESRRREWSATPSRVSSSGTHAEGR